MAELGPIDLQAVLAANERLKDTLEISPKSFPVVVLHGANPAELNALARHWMSKHNASAKRLVPVESVPCCKTCEAYTVIDLAAASTPGERTSAMLYLRDITKLRHATRVYHSFLVYNMHLATSRSFMGLKYARVLGTTNRPQSLSDTLRSQCAFVRVRTVIGVPRNLAALARTAIASDCIEGARRYSHEALKACLDPASAYLALVEQTQGMEEDAARLEHLSLHLTRPVHALELMALVAASETNAAIVRGLKGLHLAS